MRGALWRMELKFCDTDRVSGHVAQSLSGSTARSGRLVFSLPNENVIQHPVPAFYHLQRNVSKVSK